MNKIKIFFIYFIGIFVFCANVYSAQIDLSSGQTWGTTRGAIQSNFDEVYSAILNTYISALIGGNINGDLVTSGTIGDSRLSTNIPLLNGTQTITGTWSFPDLSYNVTSWDGILTPATKNSLRDYFYIFDADGDGDFTDESWFPTVNTFDPTAPGEIGGITPSIGNFTTINADEFVSSAADGDRGIILPENTSKTPGTGLEEIYNEAGQLKYSENGVEKDFLEINDSESALTTTYSSSKIQELISGVSGAAGYVTPPTYSDDPGTDGQYSWDESFFYAHKNGSWDKFAVTWAGMSPAPTVPTLTSLTIPTSGDTATAVFSEAMTIGAGGSGGWTLSSPTNEMTYASGTGTDTIVFNLASTILSTENPTVSYTQPTNGFESADDGVDLASIPGAAVTNNSTQTGGTDYSDVILHLNADGVVAATVYTPATTETAGGNGTIGSMGNTAAGAALIGGKGFTFPTSGDSVSVPVSITNAGSVLLAARIKLPTFTALPNRVLSLTNADDSRFCGVAPINDGDTNELTLHYRNEGGTYVTISTDNANLLSDTEYIVTILVNEASPVIRLSIYNTSYALLDSVESTVAFTKPVGGWTRVYMASGLNLTTGMYIDNIMVSDLSNARDFINDTIAGVRMVDRNDKP